MKTQNIIIVGATVTAPVHVAWIVGSKTISADYQQITTLKPGQVILPKCGKGSK